MQVLSYNLFSVMVCKLAPISIISGPVLPEDAVLISGQILPTLGASNHLTSDVVAFLSKS